MSEVDSLVRDLRIYCSDILAGDLSKFNEFKEIEKKENRTWLSSMYKKYNNKKGGN